MSEYSSEEERINIITHAVGCILSIIALVILVKQATVHGDVKYAISVVIFGVSLIVLYAASTLYHSAKPQKLRNRLKIVDHSAIYILIAGTYTPFCLITLEGTIGWTILTITWGMALIGVVLKLFYTGKYELISTLMYVFMGWMIVFAIKPLIDNLPVEGLYWLLAGGVFYTIGAVVYSIQSINFNHAIFHMFVLAGSFCHFYSVLCYVLPTN
jgi:hemolysin III